MWGSSNFPIWLQEGVCNNVADLELGKLDFRVTVERIILSEWFHATFRVMTILTDRSVTLFYSSVNQPHCNKISLKKRQKIHKILTRNNLWTCAALCQIRAQAQESSEETQPVWGRKLGRRSKCVHLANTMEFLQTVYFLSWELSW